LRRIHVQHPLQQVKALGCEGGAASKRGVHWKLIAQLQNGEF
jgi:hypothetical protein